MITLRVWFLVNATALLLAIGVWMVLSRPAAAHRRPASPSVASSIVAGTSATGRASSLSLNSDALRQLLKSAEPHRDVYGNQIEDAITDYRIDSAGAVYERHSPETEVPRLGPPVS